MKTRRHLAHIAILALALLAMTSCASPVSTMPPVFVATTALAKATTTNVPDTITPTATFYLMSPDVTSTVSSIFNNPDQATDGKLKITIEEFEKDCHHPGDTIFIRVIYQNLTNKPLTIVDYNVVSDTPLMGTYGQLIDILTTVDNRRVFSPAYYSGADLINTNSTVFQEMQPTSSFSFLVEYHLPNKLAETDESRQLNIFPIPPGQYLLRFVYVALEFKDSWTGKISSNQVEICVSS